MKTKVHVLQLAPMGRLLRKAGADRVSETAKQELREILEDFGIELSRKAIKFANHAGRTTIKGEDVSLASKE
jgi:histone H3/H4